MIVGIVSGIIVVFGNRLLEKLKLDDAVGAVPVHGFVGMWGTIATGIFIKNSFLLEFGISRGHQIIVQVLGAAAALAWGLGVSLIMMKVINRFFPMRVSPAHEEIGLNIAEHGASSSILELSNSVRKIIESRNFRETGKIEVEYGTEIGELTNYFNTMIDDLRIKEDAAEEALSSLHQMAITDGLTQIYNRKFISDTLIKEIARSIRYESKLSVLMFDVDFFKEINDKYGHPSGDKVLTEISKKVKESLRESDYFGRYGGEEFLVIFPETDLANAYIISNRIKESIECMCWDFSETCCVTVSGGVVENFGEDFDRMIKRADNLLYYAKENGRNRIIK